MAKLGTDSNRVLDWVIKKKHKFHTTQKQQQQQHHQRQSFSHHSQHHKEYSHYHIFSTPLMSYRAKKRYYKRPPRSLIIDGTVYHSDAVRDLFALSRHSVPSFPPISLQTFFNWAKRQSKTNMNYFYQCIITDIICYHNAQVDFDNTFLSISYFPTDLFPTETISIPHQYRQTRFSNVTPFDPYGVGEHLDPEWDHTTVLNEQGRRLPDSKKRHPPVVSLPHHHLPDEHYDRNDPVWIGQGDLFKPFELLPTFDIFEEVRLQSLERRKQKQNHILNRSDNNDDMDDSDDDLEDSEGGEDTASSENRSSITSTSSSSSSSSSDESDNEDSPLSSHSTPTRCCRKDVKIPKVSAAAPIEYHRLLVCIAYDLHYNDTNGLLLLLQHFGIPLWVKREQCGAIPTLPPITPAEAAQQARENPFQRHIPEIANMYYRHHFYESDCLAPYLPPIPWGDKKDILGSKWDFNQDNGSWTLPSNDQRKFFLPDGNNNESPVQQKKLPLVHPLGNNSSITTYVCSNPLITVESDNSSPITPPSPLEKVILEAKANANRWKANNLDLTSHANFVEMLYLDRIGNDQWETHPNISARPHPITTRKDGPKTTDFYFSPLQRTVTNITKFYRAPRPLEDTLENNLLDCRTHHLVYWPLSEVNTLIYWVNQPHLTFGIIRRTPAFFEDVITFHEIDDESKSPLFDFTRPSHQPQQKPWFQGNLLAALASVETIIKSYNTVGIPSGHVTDMNGLVERRPEGRFDPLPLFMFLFPTRFKQLRHRSNLLDHPDTGLLERDSHAAYLTLKFSLNLYDIWHIATSWHGIVMTLVQFFLEKASGFDPKRAWNCSYGRSLNQKDVPDSTLITMCCLRKHYGGIWAIIEHSMYDAQDRYFTDNIAPLVEIDVVNKIHGFCNIPGIEYYNDMGSFLDVDNIINDMKDIHTLITPTSSPQQSSKSPSKPTRQSSSTTLQIPISLFNPKLHLISSLFNQDNECLVRFYESKGRFYRLFNTFESFQQSTALQFLNTAYIKKFLSLLHKIQTHLILTNLPKPDHLLQHYIGFVDKVGFAKPLPRVFYGEIIPKLFFPSSSVARYQWTTTVEQTPATLSQLRAQEERERLEIEMGSTTTNNPPLLEQNHNNNGLFLL